MILQGVEGQFSTWIDPKQSKRHIATTEWVFRTVGKVYAGIVVNLNSGLVLDAANPSYEYVAGYSFSDAPVPENLDSILHHLKKTLVIAGDNYITV